MIEKYVTLEEAATLEGISYNALKIRMYKSDTHSYKKVFDTNKGGHDRIMIAVSSLSDKARRLYREKQRIDVNRINKLDEESAPWYCTVNWQEYKEKYRMQYNKALELSRHIKDCIDYPYKDKTEYINEYAKELGMSGRTLHRKIKAYTEAAAWAIELGKDGDNYDYIKVLALCKEPPTPKGRRALNEEMKALIENIWFDPNFAANRCKYMKLYRLFCEEMKKQTDESNLPSYDTVVRYIRDDIRPTTDNARVLMAQGLREFKRVSMTKARRDLRKLRVMELVVADTHTFDCFVEVTEQNGIKRAVKPCLVGFMDMRSRALVGWSICEIPNAQVIKETIIHMIMPKKNKSNPFEGVPRVLLIDNGKDYTAESLTGRNRKVRVAIDDETEGFYNEVGIEKDMRSLPYQAWTKGQIERFFGSVCEDFTKDMASYTGTLTGSLTAGKVKKDIKHMFERGELLSIEDFAARFEYWVLEVYSKRKHGGLKDQKEQYKTPLEVYENEERYFKPAPPIEYLERILMVKTHKKVYATGIRLFGCDYMAEELCRYINSSKGVTVRYDSKDVREIFCYDAKTDKFICSARNATILDPLAPIGDKTLENHIKLQKRHEKQAREIIAAMQMPFEERIANVYGQGYAPQWTRETDPSRSAVLRTGDSPQSKERKTILPELSEEQQKVTAIPRSKAFKAEVNEAAEKKRIEERNKYLNEIASDVVKELGLA